MAKVDSRSGAERADLFDLYLADADRADTLDARMQRLETQAVSEGISASGLTADQFTEVRERISSWWAHQDAPDPNEGFTKGEVAILKSHRAEIEKMEDIL